ncbi:hypothetical protein NIES25_07060 [Nostoc linckia NIES-25]|nr:hypothetical protein NIES25_07060 [Nostoc linckia NIES-25]
MWCVALRDNAPYDYVFCLDYNIYFDKEIKPNLYLFRTDASCVSGYT